MKLFIEEAKRKALVIKGIKPFVAFETRDYKSVKEFKNKGEFLEYIKPQLKKVKHPHISGSKTVRPYVVGYGCDGSTDANIHYIAQKTTKTLGFDYAEIYDKAYPDERGKGWITENLGELKDEALKTQKVKDTTVIPKNATIQDVLDDLYDINNRSLVEELENSFEKAGISLETKLGELKIKPTTKPTISQEAIKAKAEGKSVEEFVNAQYEKQTIRNPKPIVVYRGEGKGIGNYTLVKGEYFADTRKFASDFGTVTKHTIPANKKIFDLDIFKDPNQKLIPHRMTVDVESMTQYLIDLGYKYTVNTNVRGREYVRLSRFTDEELIMRRYRPEVYSREELSLPDPNTKYKPDTQLTDIYKKATAKPPIEKQAWQMTKDEFTEKWIECSNCFGLVPDNRGILKEKAIKEAPIIHKEHIRKALKEGKSVPREVLVEYPLSFKEAIRLLPVHSKENFS